jgi:sterol desaturase/sphingolipid hydroxylase (fatty acid hydroxylase superfamily)
MDLLTSDEAAVGATEVATLAAPAPCSAGTNPGARAAALRFRTHYRHALMPRGYDGRRHALTVLALGVAAELALVLAVPQAFAWPNAWVVPATLVLASFVEYWAHRVPMHRRVPGLSAVFDRHTRRHHRYFTVSASRFHAHHDGHAVFFPTVLLVFFGAICALLGSLVALLTSTAVAVAFVATSIAYYLLYETLHFAYHCPTRWRLGRLPIVRVLAHHHRTHHAKRNMGRRNFNLVLPLFDWLLGTLAWGHAARKRAR